MPILALKHCRIEPSPEDGVRLLVMRYWPRGVRRERFDRWLRDLAPSKSLLRSFRIPAANADLAPAGNAHWEAFVRDYVIEMEDQRGLIDELRLRHEHGETLTVLCGCHDPCLDRQKNMLHVSRD